MQHTTKAPFVRIRRYMLPGALFVLLVQCTQPRPADFTPSSEIAAAQYPTILEAQTRKDALQHPRKHTRTPQNTIRQSNLIRANMRSMQPLGIAEPPIRVANHLPIPVSLTATARKPQPFQAIEARRPLRSKQPLNMPIAKSARKAQAWGFDGLSALAAARRKASALKARRIE